MLSPNGVCRKPRCGRGRLEPASDGPGHPGGGVICGPMVTSWASSGGKLQNGKRTFVRKRAWEHAFEVWSQSAGDRAHEAASVLRKRAMAPGRPRTFMIRPVVS